MHHLQINQSKRYASGFLETVNSLGATTGVRCGLSLVIVSQSNYNVSLDLGITLAH